MAASAPKSSAGDDRNLVTIDENYLAPTFEDRLQIFWEKNARTVTAVIVIIALALVGRWLFGVFAAQRERAVQSAYAAATNTEQLKAFIAENPRASLSGVASLRIADEAYAAGNFTAARDAYIAAAPLLVGNPLASRARLGAAVSPLLAGDAAAAKAALDALANDTTLIAGVRAEAAYHLAVLARDAGQTAEATRLTGVVLSVDPEGMWAQRALQLRSSLPPEPAPAVTPSAPAAASSSTEAAAGVAPTVTFPAAK